MSDLTREQALAKANELAGLLGPEWTSLLWLTDHWHFAAQVAVKGASAMIEGGYDWKDAEYTITLNAGKNEVIIGASDPALLFTKAMSELKRKVMFDYDAYTALSQVQKKK